MWNVKYIIKPVVIGANVRVSKGLKENLENHASKKFSRFTKKHNYTWSITHNMGSTATLNLKPEWWVKQQLQQQQQ
jgi:predicted GIY-YIG superfamily endonuclease